MITGAKHSAVQHLLYPVTEQVHTYTFDSLWLQQGVKFGPVTLAYETWGTLNAAGDNAVLMSRRSTLSSSCKD